jgi:aspartokinase/homoserine dehydrogenase 1
MFDRGDASGDRVLRAHRRGHVTIFERNGSDYSAAVVAKPLNADALEIWKDVDGFVGRPQDREEAVPIDMLSYDEAAELSISGHRSCIPGPLSQRG